MSFTSPAPARWTDVYLSAVARGVSTCGDFVAAVALVLALQARGAGGFAVAAVLLGAAVPPAVLAPLTGRLVDRVDSRLLLVTVVLAQAGVCALLAYATGTGTVIALVALLGTGLAVTQPAFSALLPTMAGPDGLARGSALGQTANAVGMLVAPVLAGVLAGQYGLRVPLLVDAVSYLALAAAALAIRTRRGGRVRSGATHRSPGAHPPASTAGDTGGPWRLRRDRLLATQLVLIGAVVAAVSAIDVAEVFFIRGTLHASATMYGVIGGAWIAGLLAGGWVLARRGYDDGRLSLASLFLLIVMTALILGSTAVPAAAWLIPFWVLAGAANGGLNVAAGVLLGRRVPEPVRGRAYAQYGGVVNGGNAFGYLLGGALLGVLAPRTVIAVRPSPACSSSSPPPR
jgi:MFS family permease